MFYKVVRLKVNTNMAATLQSCCVHRMSPKFQKLKHGALMCFAYNLKEMAGIMLCQHVAVATSGATSGTNGSSFEHHAILDAYAPNGACYIHVSSIGSATGEMRVIRTPKRIFEREFAARPRILAEPASREEARQILLRARKMIDGPNQGAWKYNILTNNCEHFVRQCWTGDKDAGSQQVQQVQDTAAALGSGAVGMVTLGGFTATVETMKSTFLLWLWSFAHGVPKHPFLIPILPVLPEAATAGLASSGAVLGGFGVGAAVGLGTMKLLRRRRAGSSG